MGWFAARRRRVTTGDPEARGELSPELRAALPPRFEAVGETLASGSGTSSACEVAGAVLARDGLSLSEALDLLAETTALVRGGDPSFHEVRSLGVAWSEATLGYLHGLSCDDPLTGLASLAHLRSRVAEVYRGPDPSPTSHALVVVADAPWPEAVTADDVLSRSMRVAHLGDTARTVFPGPETIGHIAPGRVVVLAGRDERMARRVGLLRQMLDDGLASARVWVEGLPDSDEGAAALLDELTRV